ncbi:MAG TPA: hypothetical protein VIJ16_03880 [Gemmatimonadaceae bacterium]
MIAPASGQVRYPLPGDLAYVERVYPNPADLDPKKGLRSYEDVIAHFTRVSLAQDLIEILADSLQVSRGANGYEIAFTPQPDHETAAAAFASAHAAFLEPGHVGLALKGADECRATGAWNPMEGFPVNAHDGPCEWFPCLPLGLPLANHRAVTLLHYPPVIAYRNADYFNNNTLRRWAQLLQCVGVDEPTLYHSILDVNPIAAPGSGQSEYPNDYFPIHLASLFYDDEARGLTYLRTMLDLLLNPAANSANPYTLPLLVCGSPLYDPQAPGWFRVRYKSQITSRDANGTPTVNVLQTGLVRINPKSPKLTPYMIANHMIAAGVTGTCTNDASKIPDIRQYEAQDLAAATFLKLYHDHPDIHPDEAMRQACQRWFGADHGGVAPNPPSSDDRLTICAMAQMDLCFDVTTALPMYTFEQAKARCQAAGGPDYAPCFGCAPVNKP